MFPPRLIPLVVVLLIGFVPGTRGQVVSEIPLQQLSRSESSESLFERVLADRSGIDFENRFDHPRRWLELWKQYYNGSIGTGVAIGDVNGDGWPDLFLVGKDSPNALYLNRGDFRFEAATEEAGVGGGEGFGTGASFVDIDNDGDLDLYVCYVAGTNELFLNDGTGRFEEVAAQWGLDFTAGSNAPSFADYDLDGDLDLYLQQNYLNGAGHLDGMPDHLFRNDNGVFFDVTEAAGIEGEGQGHTALWWDFNEDGWPDIYVSNDFEPVDKLYRNNGDGTFTDVLREVLGGAPYSSMGVDAGDLNNDGHLELFAAEMLARDRDYYQQAVGPLSGKLISAKRSGVDQYMQNMLWSPIGPSEFVEVGRYANLFATDWTWAVRFADLDNDGLLDVFAANGMARAFHDGDLAIKISKARSLSARVRIYETSPPLREKNLAFRNLGDLRFESVGESWGLDTEGVTFAAALGDLDRDGDLDLVTSDWKDPVGIYRNHSQEGHRILIQLEGVASNRMGVGARVELAYGDEMQVREVSLTRGYMSVDDPVLHFALPQDVESASLRIAWPSGETQRVEGVETGKLYRIREAVGEELDEEFTKENVTPDFRKSSIRVPVEAISREDRFASRKGQFLLPFTEDRLGPPLAVADLNGDGWEDVVLGGATGQPTRILMNREGKELQVSGDGVFEDDDLCEDAAVIPFDFDGDGKLDLFVASGGVELDSGDEFYEDRLYLNTGDERFQRLDWNASPVATRDAVLLGDQLILAGGTIRDWYPQVEPHLVFELRTESFVSRESSMISHDRTSRFYTVDLDRDGVGDLVQLAEYGRPEAYRVLQGGEFEVWPEVFAGIGSGIWRSAAFGDFNGDGLEDVLLGGLGENNKYLVSPATPAVLFAPKEEAYQGKFIEAETIEGRLYPRDSRIFHQVDFPEIAKQTGSYAEFAKLDVEAAFGEETLGHYGRYEFIERSTKLLLQQPDGRFEAVLLPQMAQLGVAIDAASFDYDGDGDLDLVLALESLSPQPPAAVNPETSFLLLLKNDGNSGFEAVLPWQSGLQSPEGEVRRLVVADLDRDGKGELIVSLSEGPLLIFEATSNGEN